MCFTSYYVSRPMLPHHQVIYISRTERGRIHNVKILCVCSFCCFLGSVFVVKNFNSHRKAT